RPGLAEARLLPRGERVLVLALPPDRERGPLRAAVAAAPHLALLRHRRPHGLRPAPRDEGAGARSGLRPGEGARRPAAGGPGRVRAARRGRVQARGDRGTAGHGGGHVEGAAPPGPEAPAGGARVMTCDEVDGRLDDYADGSLSEGEFQEVELHLSTCAACREQERRLRLILAEARALPRELSPSRDLWAGVAQRIEAGRRGRATWWLGLAAAAVLVGAVSVSLLRRSDPVPVSVSAPGPVTVPVS